MNPYGHVSGIEKMNGEPINIIVNPKEYNGTIYVNEDELIESYDDISIGDDVYSVSFTLLTTKPDCDQCDNEFFVMDDDSLYCPACE